LCRSTNKDWRGRRPRQSLFELGVWSVESEVVGGTPAPDYISWI